MGFIRIRIGKATIPSPPKRRVARRRNSGGQPAANLPEIESTPRWKRRDKSINWGVVVVLIFVALLIAGTLLRLR